MDKWYDKQVLQSIKDQLDAKLDLAADITVGEIVTRTPVKTGFLKGNTRWKKIGRLVRRVFNNTEYAADVEFGTRPHVIYPKEKKALKFKKDSKEVFATKVKHPGTPAQPFFRPGYRAALPLIKKILGQ
jgi:hypothetical protein